MLHLGEQNLVAGFNVLRTPGGGHEVDAFGGAARENDFLGAASVDELGGARPGGLEGGGGAIAQFMNAAREVGVLALGVMGQGVGHGAIVQCVEAAIDVGVVALVVMAQRVEHGARVLGGGGVVEIN